ncbi:alpha/beta fold hydrolase, partial [Streptomyces sp. NPDC015032]|uniref:alpha/beta fold hydrolase n=1 Tax=Streptomyces sp. NPDC015032 TaxID=3364937 RepID=UPI0036FFC4A6
RPDQPDRLRTTINYAGHRRMTTGVHDQGESPEVERQDLREVVLVGHSYSGVPSGQAAGRIRDRLAHVVFLDSSVPADGEPFVSAWPDDGAMVKASIAENGLLNSGRRRLIEMDTGHWPMFSQPRELAQILLDTAGV